VRTGYAADPEIRRISASGGIITTVLIALLERGYIDAAIVVRQGIPSPEKARVVLARSPEEIRAAAQSVYIPVSVLDILRELRPGERYAMTCLPDQAAALRVLQQGRHAASLQVRYVIGPYAGTALVPAAIDCYLRSKRVRRDDPITSLRWRDGEWPGYLEIRMQSGQVFRSKKAHYNFLIPFFITQNSLQNMDFANEFCDLSVGDAWSPVYERKGGGFAVFATRSKEMEALVEAFCRDGLLVAEKVDPLEASEMHGHMIDFKKRGGYLRNRMRRLFGAKAPDFGMRPSLLPLSRIAVELVISGIFLACRSRPARKLLEWIPESIIGPLFNQLRLSWKAISKPTKRRDLAQLTMIPEEPS
jgi:coenzyme F420 hydrogenase subunit beta